MASQSEPAISDKNAQVLNDKDLMMRAMKELQTPELSIQGSKPVRIAERKVS